MTSTGPPPPTGPRNLPQNNPAAIRRRFKSIDKRIAYREKDRLPTPTGLHQLSNAPLMQIAQDGSSPVWSEASGSFNPSPVLATLLFNMPGDLSLATSDPLHARYPCNIVGISADVGFSSDLTFEVLVNGSVAYTIGMTGPNFSAAVASTPLNPYTDLVTIETTDVGSGNSGLVVHIELSLDQNNLPTG